MKIYLNDIIDVHTAAFNFDNNEEELFENIVFDTINDEILYDDFSLYIDENILIKYYTNIMFKFIEILLQ
ncbi:hypothetical protein [Clostridium butyricum]|uniref:hypothetical protein n=1 Tax=Clostridium butyricum TaxID=1492 RepID=UPI000903915E|nr:hypothetical protein [Clostridium butyricum]APF25046.1 hypothetical protein NPD4_3273 [Clostridium butyricum]